MLKRVENIKIKMVLGTGYFVSLIVVIIARSEHDELLMPSKDN